ncbi:glycine--tRNA ligase [Candidatus Microgenomates bacterium]|nr:MAG: glycine--tRNA ligase [Candidatus Microgenomates bacterium]
MASLEEIVSLCKRRGFVFPSSEIYGGWEATYDFGPLGAEMLRNLRDLWWEEFVQRQENIVGLDGAIISHPKVWEASGHTEGFADIMVEDLVNHKRYRADHLTDKVQDGATAEEVDEIIVKNGIKSPDGNKLSKAKKFNTLVEVYVGTLESEKTLAYLRGETCQPIFYNYQLVKDSMRMKVPFGIAQIGKAFRNEIKVGPFFFRTREFEQMELEMYVHHTEADQFFNKFKTWSVEWLAGLGINKDKLKLRDQEFKERAHYNKIATDLEYEFPFGWKEFQGIHYRGDWDLRRHAEFSGSDFTYKDEKRNEDYVPHVVEYSIGLNRLMLVLLFDAFNERDGKIVLKLDPRIAPYKAAVFPLLGNKPELIALAREVYDSLRAKHNTAWDDRGNIGKRYAAQDEVGTPWCITVDFQSLEDNTVTCRERDTGEQTRMSVDNLLEYIENGIK